MVWEPLVPPRNVLHGASLVSAADYSPLGRCDQAHNPDIPTRCQPMKFLILCSAVLALLYALLSVNVSRMRRRKLVKPETTDFALHQAVRAHGNASEYVPLFVASFLYLSYFPQNYYLAALGILATLSRIAHAIGMLRTSSAGEKNLLRMLGAVGTYACLFGIAAVFARHGW